MSCFPKLFLPRLFLVLVDFVFGVWLEGRFVAWVFAPLGWEVLSCSCRGLRPLAVLWVFPVFSDFPVVPRCGRVSKTPFHFDCQSSFCVEGRRQVSMDWHCGPIFLLGCREVWGVRPRLTDRGRCFSEGRVAPLDCSNFAQGHA